jgi:HAMP domain-containing protein
MRRALSGGATAVALYVGGQLTVLIAVVLLLAISAWVLLGPSERPTSRLVRIIDAIRGTPRR